MQLKFINHRKISLFVFESSRNSNLLSIKFFYIFDVIKNILLCFYQHLVGNLKIYLPTLYNSSPFPSQMNRLHLLLSLKFINQSIKNSCFPRTWLLLQVAQMRTTNIIPFMILCLIEWIAFGSSISSVMSISSRQSVCFKEQSYFIILLQNSRL